MTSDTQQIVAIRARDFFQGNVNKDDHQFGKDLIVDGGMNAGFARYQLTLAHQDDIEVWARYASGVERPTEIYLDGVLLNRYGLSMVTGGWTRTFLEWYKEAEIRGVSSGEHILEIKRDDCIPHIDMFAIFTKGKPPDFIIDEIAESRKLILGKRDYPRLPFFTRMGRFLFHPIKTIKENYLDVLGIYEGAYGYKGPFHVQIDITNNCNNNCIACWCNSPLLEEKKLSDEKKREYLPYGLVKEVLDEARSMGATEIYYSGSGEPFMHPDIMKIVEYTKKKGLVCHINTNFTLLDKKKIDCLIDLSVEHLTVSVWAGSAQTYIDVHPGRTEEDFHRIKELLLYLNAKKKDSAGFPLVKIYEVLFNMNYHDVENMISFAEETNSESVEFTLADTIPEKTETLRLNAAQTQELIARFDAIKGRLNRNRRLPSGLLLFGIDQFLRRISVTDDVKEAKYDRNIIDSMPCYIGWLFARVIPNGELHSCLKAHRIPTGSLYRERFASIWNSKKQQMFRKKTRVYKKSDPFFRLIGNDPCIQEAGCYKSCDDIGRNRWMHKKLKEFPLPKKLFYKLIALGLKTVRHTGLIKSKTSTHPNPVTRGIIDGRHAFAGPEQVVIDITNRCNLHCNGCWLYSPLLDKDKPSKEWIQKELSRDTLFKLIDDLALLKTKEVRFTGGGEPFMHKDLTEGIRYARKKNIDVSLTTHLGLASKEDIKKLSELAIRELCVSIWASNDTTYKRVHPQVSEDHFNKVRENLEYLKNIRTKNLRLTFANVISSVNADDFINMYEFARTYGADAVYYTVVDIFKDQTDSLLPTDEQRQALLRQASEVKEKAARDNICLEFFDGFLNRLTAPKDDFSCGLYDKNTIDSIPCYVGWFFARILADGGVAPCCRGVTKILGNINESSFKKIWESDKYNEFRARAKFASKSTDYFKDIGCIKECDNLMHNKEMHSRIQSFL